MPIRMLRDWTDSVTLDGVSADGERLFVRLIMKADDYGRFHADPRLVRALCFPLSETLKSDTVRRWLDELHRAGLIYRYEVDEKLLLAVVNFGQRLKQSRAKFPEPAGESEDWLPTSGNFREVAGIPTSGNFREVAGTSGLKTNRNRRETEHELESDDDGPCRGIATGPQREFADEQWISELSADPTFAGIDVRKELGKCRAWCKANGKQATRRRFVNWLNRADTPLLANGTNPSHQPPRQHASI